MGQEYKLDTSLSRETAATLDAFTLAYVEALFWTLTDEDGNPMDHLGLHDLADDALAAIMGECAAFQEHAGSLIAGHESQAGHDFWLTRNGHGAGFWDRGELYGDNGEGDTLTKLAKACGTSDAYVGDDEMVYV